MEVVPGNWVPIWQDCADHVCSCVYILEGEHCQLKPCQFAASILQFKGVTWDDMYVLTGIYRGFRIVDHGCEASYYCSNYDSLVGSKFSGDMTERIREELACGKVRKVNKRPRCVHALGGVEKSDHSLRPITDCSRRAEH